MDTSSKERFEDMRQFVCDLCEKATGLHEGPASAKPEGWGTITLRVQSRYDIPINLKGDLCAKCFDHLKDHNSEIFKFLKQVGRGKT